MTAIRFAIELLGSDHVLAGSDWPIYADRVASASGGGSLNA